MKKILIFSFLLVAVGAFAQSVGIRDVPNVQNDFWNTSGRCLNPVEVDRCVTDIALTEIEARTSTCEESSSIPDMDSRFATRSVSNGANIRGPVAMVIHFR